MLPERNRRPNEIGQHFQTLMAGSQRLVWPEFYQRKRLPVLVLLAASDVLDLWLADDGPIVDWNLFEGEKRINGSPSAFQIG
jgi:hypothetical protein